MKKRQTVADVEAAGHRISVGQTTPRGWRERCDAVFDFRLPFDLRGKGCPGVPPAKRRRR